MRINNNIPSLVTYNSLSATLAATQKVIQRLSTGLRINSAADDAAGLAISEKMRAQIRGIDKAVSNSQDGISMIQTAEGAMNESHSILQRMRELSVQAANDSLTMDDRQFIQLEIDQLKEELDRIANTTQFNKKKLLDGSADALWSTDLLGTEVFVNGTTVSQDQFGQTSAMEGNFTVAADVVKAGRNQVLKSNILTVETRNGVAAANVGVALSDLTNFVDANGVNLLQNPQTLTVSVEGGTSVSITLYGDDTIGGMGEKLNAALYEASGIAASLDAGVQYVSDGGALSGIEADNALIVGMATNWLYGAVKRVYDVYGFDPAATAGKTLTIRIVDDLGAAAATGGGVFGGDGEITISREALLDIAGNPLDADMFERTLAHEMVHVLTFTHMDERSNIDIYNMAHIMEQNQWLSEGLAEYVHGANDRIYSSNVDSVIAAAKKLIQNPTMQPIDLGSDGYTAAYLIVRYIDEASRANGGAGMGKVSDDPTLYPLVPLTFLGILGNYALPLGDALMNSSGYLFGNYSGPSYDSNPSLDVFARAVEDLKWAIVNDTSSLSDYVNGTSNGESFAAFVSRVAGEAPNIDTGAVDGSYATRDITKAKTHETIVQGNNTYSAQPLLADFGWTVVWPTEITAASAGGASSTKLAISAGRDDTLQAVNGTLLLHSNIAGLAGQISISGDENLIKALGFAEIQSARDTVYEVRITDAHSGDLLTSGVRISGGAIYGALHENIDIRLINNFAIGVNASNLRTDGYGTYVFEESGRNSFVVHIAANSAVLQIGANQGENMVISFGNISASALGVDKVSVRDRELAARATTLIDNAISKVSTKRARLGAYQNRLEHTITNLTAASTNTAAAESRIRDADMAKEMINFTRLNILSQAGNSMLGQANQLPQNVLNLLR